jgi:hypothetical protein
MSTFSNPAAPSSGIKWDDHKGALLVIEPKEFEANIPTTYGFADAVKADVYVIDGPGAGSGYNDTLVFPKLLVSQLKAGVGTKILGRLGQGTAKSGQSAPWLLEAATPADQATGEKWLANLKPLASAEPPF